MPRRSASAAARTRIVIIDDHPIVRRGLRNIVESENDLEVVAEGATAHDAATLTRTTPCDVIVLDLNVPGAVGLSVLKAFRTALPQVPVLILSMASEDQFGVRVIRAGAAGFIAKRSAPEHLADAIRRVASGSLYVSAATGQKLALESSRPEPRAGRRAANLSDREIEVLRLLGGGLSGTAIAATLGVSPKTVSTYRRRLLTKLQLDSTAALLRYAIAHDIIDS